MASRSRSIDSITGARRRATSPRAVSTGPTTRSHYSSQYASRVPVSAASLGSAIATNHRHVSGPYTTSQRHATERHATERYATEHRYLTGQERVIGVSSRVDETRTEIIGERTVEHSIRVPKRVVHEDVIEKVMVIPETVRREEIIEEVQVVRERIIEVARPIIQEKIVEVPEYVYVDKIVEVPQVIVQEKLREVPRIEYQERVHEIPKIITQEKIVEVPEVEYHEYVVEKVVEVPEIREQIVTKQVPIPQYVDRPMPEYVDIEEHYDVQRNIPIPVEAVSTFEYRLPNFKPRVNRVQYPIYVPRFIEVPVAEELFHAGLVAELNQNCAQVNLLASMSQAVSLCEVENLATMVRSVDVETSMAANSLHSALKEAWMSGSVRIQQGIDTQDIYGSRQRGLSARHSKKMGRSSSVKRSRTQQSERL